MNIVKKMIEKVREDIGNNEYIIVRVRVCTMDPAIVNDNRTPPPPSQKHHFTQEHQINFCIDESHHASDRRAVAIVINFKRVVLWHR